jgi:hypothetical protein
MLNRLARVARVAVLFGAALTVLTLRTARAQTRTLLVRVYVADSSGARVSDADVAIVRGLKNVVGHGATGAAGSVSIAMPRAEGDLAITVRKIGFARADQFVAPGAHDTITVRVALRRNAVELARVVTTADEDLKRKSYHLDADDIANSSRPILDGMDIFKLRPDMLNSRGGHQACELPRLPHDPSPHTGWIEHVWVNGREIKLVPLETRAVARRSSIGVSPHTDAPQLDTVLTILSSIHPEHIAEVTYHDCFDGSVGRNNGEMAVFITLKPGIGFEPVRGSYVVAQPSTDAEGVPLYRRRLLGVYDAATGSPLSGVEVSDTLSGLHALTTATGTLSLFYLPDGGAPLRVRKSGYADTTFFARISARDTMPITLVLLPAGKAP